MRKLFILGSIAILLTGCAHQDGPWINTVLGRKSSPTCDAKIIVNRSSYRDKHFENVDVSSGKFFVLQNDKMFLRVASRRIHDMIEEMLKSQGYQIVESAEEANYLVTYWADLGDSVERSLEPVFNTASSSVNINGQWGYVTTTTTSYVERENHSAKRWLDLEIYSIEQGGRKPASVKPQSVWVFESSSKGKIAGLEEAADYHLTAAAEVFMRNKEDRVAYCFER